MSDAADRRLESTMRSTHRGRPFPPRGWGLEVTPGWGAVDKELHFVQVPGALTLLPARFVLSVRTAGEPPVRMALFFAVTADDVALDAVKASGASAVEATDLLRKHAPMEKWAQLALRDLGFRMLIHQAVRAGDAESMLQRLGLSPEVAHEFVAMFGDGGTWISAQSDNIGALQLEDPAWQAALKSWRDEADAGAFGSHLDEVQLEAGKRRNRVTRDHLAEVARVYRLADQRGRPPTAAVAQHFNAAHRTATRWVGMARDAGLLGPARRGKGGEQAVVDQDEVGGEGARPNQNEQRP